MYYRLSLKLLALSLVAGCHATPAYAAQNVSSAPPPITQAPSHHQSILAAMTAELHRSRDSLKLDGYDSPYFVGYRLFDVESASIYARFGGIEQRQMERLRNAYVEVRVGDYAFDNFANIDSESYRTTDSYPDENVPYGSDEAAIRGTFWLLTDVAYKQATSDYLTKKGGAVFDSENKTKVPSFSKEKAVSSFGEVVPFTFDAKKWTSIAEAVTSAMKDKTSIIDSNLSVSANRVVRYFVSTEGATQLESRLLYSLHLEAWTRADDGMKLEKSQSFYARSEGKLPDQKQLLEVVDSMASDLEQLKNAPTIDPYTGPAILMPEAAGVLFHEAVGHRLEGERQRDDQEGQTFKGREGKVVLPRFLSVVDDPTRQRVGEVDLNGFYNYDDEGIPAQIATLIEDGVLRSFLTSRTPVDATTHSNGHGRASGTNKPFARMANLLVEADPSHQVSLPELKKMLIEEVKRQKKPFGLIIKDIIGGSTNTSGYGYQAFKGTPQMIYKVDPETGKETLVRGAELVGTPLMSINKITAASNEPGVFNGYCGAESGWVPVSAVAPALLTTEIELQRATLAKERAPILGPPWSPKK